MLSERQVFKNQTLNFEKEMSNCLFENCTVTFMKGVSTAEFTDCPKITVMGNTTHGRFIDCKKITIMGGCSASIFETNSQITIMGNANKTSFTLCPKINVMGKITDCTRDGDTFVQDVIQTGGSGNVVRGTFYQSSSGGGGGNFFSGSVGGTVRSVGDGDKYINGNRIPAALGFYTIEQRRGGQLFGQKRGAIDWYVYQPSRGETSKSSAWVPAAESTLLECQLCGDATVMQEQFPHPLSKDGTPHYFCSNSCQKLFYKGKK